MTLVAEPEIVERSEPARTPGLVGALLALLTMGAALGVGFLVFFGRLIASSFIIWAVWPVVFTPELTQWAFGAPRLGYLKIFLSLVAAGAVIKLLWRQSWPRK